MGNYEYFIPQNTAPAGARVIGVYNEDDAEIGQIPLGGLKENAKGPKLYSFLLLADTHVCKNDTATGNFEKAMQYLGEQSEISFACIAGDLVEDGSMQEHWDAYNAAIHYANGKPVYASTGNHEQDSFSSEYIEHRRFFVKHIGDDVFIFLQCFGYLHAHATLPQCQYYPVEALRAIYRIFEKYRNKRCFVFQHVPVTEGFKHFELDTIQSAYYLPLSLFQHYKNQVVFYGHLHRGVSAQKTNAAANVDVSLGFKSIHVPTLCSSGEFFIADVYKNGIRLQTVNIGTKEVQPLGCFWIDTPIETIEAGTYYTE